MCPIVDGMAVNALNTNAQKLDRVSDDTASGKIGMNNSDPLSGAALLNVQRCINRLFTTTGVNENVNSGFTYAGVPANTLVSGMTHEIALVTLARFFHGITGHNHNGVDGNGPQLSITGGGGGGSLSRSVTGNSLSPLAITAAGGIPFPASGTSDLVMYLQGSGGYVDLTANPQIAKGNTDGQMLFLRFCSISNSILIEDGAGVILNGSIEGVAGMVAQFMWDASASGWIGLGTNFS